MKTKFKYDPKWTGTRVKRLRLRHQMTQIQFAARLGVSYASVNRWENDQARPSHLAVKRMEELEQLQKGEANGRTG